MRGEVQLRSDKLAVLIDADNASADLIEPLLKEVTKYGVAHVRRIYGDWTSPQLTRWKEKLHAFAIQPIQQFSYTTGKNSTDSALIIDAMDLLYTRNFDGFCIVSSDSDFTKLAGRIREAGLIVYGFGEKKTPKAFIRACDKFIYTEILRDIEDSVASGNSTAAIEGKSKNSPGNPSGIAVEIENTQLKSNSELTANKELIRLLQDAYEATAEEDGWANLGPFGAQLTKLSPSFDQRNYGYKKLKDLVRATDKFDIKETPHDKSPTVKELHIRLKN